MLAVLGCADDLSDAVFGKSVFCGYFGIDKHGRHLGAQQLDELRLYALVALLEDCKAHIFLYWFLAVSVISSFFIHREIRTDIAERVTDSPLSMRRFRRSSSENSAGRSSKSTLLWLRLPCSSICVCIIRKFVTHKMSFS